jgi:hypothetical protein
MASKRASSTVGVFSKSFTTKDLPSSQEVLRTVIVLNQLVDDNSRYIPKIESYELDAASPGLT